MATGASTTLATVRALLLKASTVSAAVMRADAVLDTRGLNPMVLELFAALDAATLALGKTVGDTTAILDVQQMDTGKSLQDALIAADTFTYTAQFQRAFDELQQILDLVQSTVGKSVDDTTPVQDTSALTMAKGVNDSYSPVDTSSTSFDKRPADSSPITDTGTVVNQNYADPTYFAADYVGDSRTF